MRNAADKVCQDWYGWLREGCIDYVLPMAYREENDRLAEAFAEWREADPGMERIIPGLSIYSRQEGKAVPRDRDLIRAQLGMCRENGARGNLFFSLAYLNDELVELLASGPYASPARPWVPAPRK